MPTFRKLWGRADNGLKKGTHTVEIVNKYDVVSFKGTKSFVLSTTNNWGG